MERRVDNVETVTLRVRRGGSFEVQHLTLCGHRLLAGHADTGIFRIVANEPPPTPQPATPAHVTRRSDDDGLATATIEITEPLALAEHAGSANPYDRRAGASRQRL
jgi:hypothetical protein